MARKDQSRWMWIAGGAALAIGVAVFLALALNSGHRNDPKMNGQPTGMTIVTSDPVPTMDAKKLLRCYVDGLDVGDMTLAECAKKNGVASQKLDVGTDDNGNVVAAPTGSLTPIPTAPASAMPGKPVEVHAAAPDPIIEEAPAVKPVSGPTGVCLRYNSNSWNKIADNMTLGQCVQALYDTRCVSPGQASYGRWADKTLRLVPRRVEISDDNASFRTLVEQGKGCSVPMVR